MPKKGTGGKDNLIPFNKLTEEEQRELSKKGGKKSGEARNKKKYFRETFASILSGNYKINEEIVSGYEAIVMAMVTKAVNGDVQAFKEIRDTIGEKPTDKVRLDGDMKFNSGGLKETLKELKKKD